MSANKFTEVPHTIGCKISQGIVCQRWLQLDGNISNHRAINHSNLSILKGLVTFIGSHLTREAALIPVLTSWWKSELILATNFGSLCPKVTEVGSQNFGYQIWVCTRLHRGCTEFPLRVSCSILAHTTVYGSRECKYIIIFLQNNTHSHYMALQVLVNFWSGNGLVPDGTKPLPDEMLIFPKWHFEEHNKMH